MSITILLIFTGQQQCAQVGYKVIREVLSVLRVTELGQSFGAHVVLYKSTNAKPFKVTASWGTDHMMT